MASRDSRRAMAMCICASWLPMPRLPEWSTIHTWSRSSRQTSTKWLPEPRVPNCLSTLVTCLVSSSVAGWWPANQRSARRATSSWPRPMPAGMHPLDPAEQRLEVVGQLARGQVELGRDHAAADVDADGRRDDRTLGGDDGSDGGAETDVGIGHERDVAFDDGQARRHLRLADRAVVDVARPGDELGVDGRGHGRSPPSGDGRADQSRRRGCGDGAIGRWRGPTRASQPIHPCARCVAASVRAGSAADETAAPPTPVTARHGGAILLARGPRVQRVRVGPCPPCTAGIAVDRGVGSPVMTSTRRLGVAAALVDDALVPGDVEVTDGAVTAVGCSPAGPSGLAVAGFVDVQVNGYGGVRLHRSRASTSTATGWRPR